MSVEKLQEIVNIKEAQSQHYEGCDAYWLIVLVDFMNRAQDQEIRADGPKRVDSNIFEKVIVFKTLFGQVFQAK